MKKSLFFSDAVAHSSSTQFPCNIAWKVNNSAGIVIFDGTADQDIQGTNTTDFYGLEVDKATGDLITVTNTYDVRNALTLTDGIIMTTTATLLIVLDGATSTVGNASSYVDGPIRKVGDDPFSSGKYHVTGIIGPVYGYQ